jgi:hypothetical protein
LIGEGVEMTVKELIAELEKMPPDAEVLTEGCDCLGDAKAVTLWRDGTVRIERTEG